MPILNQGKHLPFQIISKLCGYFSPVPSQPLCPCHQQYSETENVTVFPPIISIHILSWRTAKKCCVPMTQSKIYLLEMEKLHCPIFRKGLAFY